MDTPLEIINDEKPIKNETDDEDAGKPQKKRGRIKTGLFCDVCNKPMRSRYHLKVHSTVHTGEKNYICHICKKGFQQKWNLITHAARVHSKVKPFKCSDCGKAFGYSSHFKRHVKTHFLEKIEAPDAVKKRILNPHKCEFCEKSFDSHYRLDIHMKKHTGDKPFICDKCGKCFTTRRLIVVHMTKKHDMEVDFICEHCGKSFPDRPAMLLHLKTGHKVCDVIEESIPQKKGRRPYHSKKDKELIPCEVCGKTINRMTMNKHLNIHYRNRVYKCKHCPKEFLESSQRAIHERRHTGEKPYLCDVCGKGHSQYGNLLTHRKRYHNLTERTPNLWKKVTASEPRANFHSEIEEKVSAPSDEVIKNITQGNPEKSAKSPYTGDETIEEFMKKATTWIDQKFKESKPARRKRAIKQSSEAEDSDEDDLPLSKLSSKKIENKNEEDCDKDIKDISDEEYLGQDNITDVEDSSQDSIPDFKETNDHSIPDVEDASQDTISDEKDEKPEMSEVELETEEPELKVNEQEPNINETESNTNESESKQKPSETESAPNAKEVKRKIHDLMYEKIIEDLVSTVEEDKLKEIIKIKITISETKSEKGSLAHLLKLLKPIPDNIVIKKVEDKLFWNCWMCNSKFHNRHLLTRHLIIHEPEENRPYKCELCQKTFTQSNNYKEHVMSHKNENQYYCEKCGVGFRHKTHFNKHLRKHNPDMIDPRPKNFKCSYCDKKFATSFHKAEHERKHTNERPYLCKTCGNQFATLSTLNKHMQVHDSAKHQCDICLKWFRHRFSLKRHLKTHSYNIDQRAHCECGASFSQRPSLKRHKLICKFNGEPVEKPFECLICLKKFGGSHDLKRHMATHETSKKFKCPICSTRFKTRETYKKHLKRHHDKPTDYEELCCDECDYTCVDVKDLTKHIINTHLSWKY